MITPRDFARNEYRDHRIYADLAAHETVPEFKRVLLELATHELEHYAFWIKLAQGDPSSVHEPALWPFRLMRRILGLTFTARYLERQEGKGKARYMEFHHDTTDAALRKKIEAFMRDEEEHEGRLIAHIKEDRVAFLSNIVLGLNDGLIELTGALVGFSFAFTDHLAVALAGSITGISASLSMAASAYMQARHEPERIKHAAKSGIYTGIAYIIVVSLLVAPFLILKSIFAALGAMSIVIALIIGATSYYTAVLFEHDFGRQARTMFLFSIGVAAVAYLIGSLFRRLTGTEL